MTRLRLRFVLSDAENGSEIGPSSAELRDLFAIVSAASTAVVVAEGEAFIDALDLPGPVRLDAKRRLARQEPVLAYPTQLVDVRQGSLVVELILDPERLQTAVSIVLTWAAGKGLDRLWETARGSARGAGETRDSMFQRSREVIEHRLSSARTKTVEIEEVIETTSADGERVVEVRTIRLPLARPRDLQAAHELLKELWRDS